MKKKLVAAMMVSVALGGQAFAQANLKVGLLSFALTDTYQAYNLDSSYAANKFGVMTNGGGSTPKHWDDTSYDLIRKCIGSVYYKSLSKKINNPQVIGAINAAMQVPGGLFVLVGSPYIGAFDVNKAKLVLVDYDNKYKAPPYPTTEDWNPFYYNYNTLPPNPWNNNPKHIYNAPWTYTASPFVGISMVGLEWPNQNYISWGKIVNNPTTAPYTGFAWKGTTVYVIDPDNKNPKLRCFDVTPFFSIDESLCEFCWDTEDRVTDGTLNAGTITTASDLPCNINSTNRNCARSGSGLVTRQYLTFKFNNATQVGAAVAGSINPWLIRYYQQILAFPTTYAVAYGVKLNPANVTDSLSALNFTVGGVFTYKWSYKAVADASGVKYNEPMGTYSCSSAQGGGYSPMCGHFIGSVTVTDKSRYDASFKNMTVCIP